MRPPETRCRLRTTLPDTYRLRNALYQSLLSAEAERPLLRGAGGTEARYGDADLAAATYAGRLAKIGVKPGMRVAVKVEKSWEQVCLYLACLRMGAVYLPLNTAYTTDEVGHVVADAEPMALICSPGEEGEYRRAFPGVEVRGMDASGDGSLWEITAEPASIAQRAASDMAAILYTSGTTGRPKGAVLSQENLLSNAQTLRSAWAFTGEDVLLHALPLFHTHGLFVAVNTAMLAGASMRMLPAFSADRVLDELPGSTVFMGVPTHYVRLLSTTRLDEDTTRSMRLFTSGSAPLARATHEAFEERTGHRILERYGMTETNMNTSNPYEGDRRAGTVGPALPGVDVRVWDPDAQEQARTNEVGMIEVRGPNVFAGYWRRPDETRESFRDDGYFITGDLGSLDADGYLTIVGRSKDLIISGGLNVYPKEVETAIDRLDQVAESAVIGLPHADFGEAVTAVVVAEPGCSPSPAKLSAALRETLAAFKCPKQILTVDQLPRNAMGKVLKNVLRERYADLYDS